MSSPYFRSYWGMPSSPSRWKPRIRGIPMAAPKPKASPKVVSIPVHFVGSESRRSDSALKIQKVLRGFLVRRSLKKIAAISNEVNQIERMISDHETINLIRRDSREGLKLSETLMNLLLRLDSVTSVDFGVRGCRKSVIKKAIALQEKLDLIASASDSQAQGHGGVEVEANTNVVSQEVNSDLHDKEGDYGYGRSEGLSEFQSLVKQDDVVMAVDSDSELRQNVEPSVSSEVMSDSEGLPVNQEASTLIINPPSETETITEAKENELEEIPKDHFLHGAETASVEKEEEKEVNCPPEIEGRNIVASESEEAVRDARRKEEQNQDRELLQWMIEDNEKMMGLMAELFERNVIQTRLLSSLSERVQKLEKAFACEKLRRKKRIDSSDKTPDTKKCDQKQ